MKKHRLNKRKWTLSEHLIPKNNRTFIRRKVEVYLRNIFSHNIYLINITTAKSLVMCYFDKFYFHWIISHHFRRDGIDCNLISRSKNIVFYFRNHRPWSSTITCNSPIHYCKDSWMNLFLYRKKIYKYLIDPCMTMMSFFRNQPTKSILD